MPPADRARALGSPPTALVTALGLPVLAALPGASCVGNSPTTINPGTGGSNTGETGSGGSGGKIDTGGTTGGTGW